ncbi:MAG: UDP-3-O-(3-hydroxymyristoyl)glucosamine N-acyltransferase [Planctomycetota bacterium]
MSLTSAELADRLNGRLQGAGDLPVRGVEAVQAAASDQVTFVTNARFAGQWLEGRAGTAVVTRGAEPDEIPPDRAAIIVDDAETALIEVLNLFAPEPDHPAIGVHPSSIVDETAMIGADVRIGAHATVGREARIGDRVVLAPGVRIGARASVGADTIVMENVVIGARCTVGERGLLHAGAVIGADGFGFRASPDGRGILKIPQIGTVEIGNDVEIGANACIDRGKFGPTSIGDGVKLDNLVQIAHNVRIGPCSLLAALTGLAGSVEVGAGVLIGGNAGASEHVKIGDGARVGAKAGVIRDVPPGQAVWGFPAVEHQQSLRQVAALRKLPDLIRDLRQQSKAESRTERPDATDAD